MCTRAEQKGNQHKLFPSCSTENGDEVGTHLWLVIAGKVVS